MTLRRLGAVFGVEFRHSFRRPLYVALAVIIVLTAYGLSSGQMSISSGDSEVGGTKAWITSEFAQTQTMTYLTILFFVFFLAIAAGMTLLRDRESRVDALLHATPLTAGEYVWGRALAVLASFGGLLLLHVLASAFFNHVVPNGSANELRGPFSWGNYLRPAAMIGIPFFVFFAGASIYLGEKSRNPILVFLVPVATFLLCGFFLWTWSPSWLDLTVNRVLQVLEPSAYRWLNETHLKVDRGVEFYNTAAVPYGTLFWLNRAWMLLGGLGGILLTQRAVAASLRGVAAAGRRRALAAPVAERPAAVEKSLGELGMRTRSVGFLRAAVAVASIEVKELFRQPGLTLFIVLILAYALGNGLIAVGVFDTPVLLTPGLTAVAVANQLSAVVCLLLIFYTVESLERERSTGLSPLVYSTPLRTGAFLFGKALANSAVAGAVLLAAFVACALALLVQATVPFSIVPYVLVWGLLILPTFLVWTTFITAVYAITGSRYGVYAVGFGVLVFTGYRALAAKMSWAGNWPLWDVMRWSDLGFYEADRVALILNRIMVVGAAFFFTVVAVRFFGRRGRDGVRVVHELAPGRAAGTAFRLLPAAAVPLSCCVALAFLVSQGSGGGAAKKAEKDYWSKNLKTWLGAPLPDIARAEVRLHVKPEEKWLSSQGTFTLVNNLDTTLAQIPLTGGRHWEKLAWTMNGKPATPEDRLLLYVFTPPRPLARGDSVVIGWSWEGRDPKGVTKNGGRTGEFVLPSGVVLTGFRPSFMPVIGFMEDVGETKENKTEKRKLPRDYWKGTTRASYGATAWFPARVTITGPAEYTLNSVGVCTSNTVKDGLRTQVWETDHPVKILNVVCGRWEEKRGEGTTIYHAAVHPYNVDEMSATLDAARRWYSEWFLPYPWKELKLSEFPALAGYAQGFGTNITFSENIGFLTKNDAKTNATFLVTAHEAAHQWWGNILTPADGPGGDLLSEGMSHFSTLLLFEKVKGPRERMEFAKGLETRYAENRRVDDERPMYEIDGSHDSDETTTYDRGGWVFWMLYDHLGRERGLQGYREFIRTWSRARDHAALQDLVAALRPHAADPAAYDAFVAQWCEGRVMPEYRVEKATKRREGLETVVTATIRNRGTGTMAVEIAATAGERWREPAAGAKSAPSEPDTSYRESRATVTLAAGESRQVTIRCGFDPERVVVDPDVRVLQLERKLALAKL